MCFTRMPINAFKVAARKEWEREKTVCTSLNGKLSSDVRKYTMLICNAIKTLDKKHLLSEELFFEFISIAYKCCNNGDKLNDITAAFGILHKNKILKYTLSILMSNDSQSLANDLVKLKENNLLDLLCVDSSVVDFIVKCFCAYYNNKKLQKKGGNDLMHKSIKELYANDKLNDENVEYVFDVEDICDVAARTDEVINGNSGLRCFKC